MKCSKEKAKSILDQDINPEERIYFESILNDQLPQYYFEELSKYRFNYSDELPEPNVPVTAPDYKKLKLEFRVKNPKMKCRAHCIVGISLTLQGINEERVLNSLEYKKIIRNYRFYDWNAFKGAKGEFWTSPEEIQFINKTLDKTLNLIKSKYNFNE